MSWWTSYDGSERDASPYDFEPPQELYYADTEPMSIEEEAEFWDLLLTREEQGIEPIF